ncbi:DUF11 domain-containing protein [uncultured Polaribacter sp.]|uniref:DUF11 domain-containing protein n=1 Tax=uncultured Polaribacter sp. TaxID=174711 RepID=UPI00260C759B|nr:DUF11 domain-containing protein [uncultured Polaribacter sp.]
MSGNPKPYPLKNKFYLLFLIIIIGKVNANGNLSDYKIKSELVFNCEDGLSASTAFISLGQARNVTAAGVYHFNIDGEIFSTYVDINGFVKIAIDFGSTSGNLPQVSALTNANRGILNTTILSKFTNATLARISHSEEYIDISTSDSAILSRITTNTTLHKGTADNSINDNWTGTESSAITVNASCTSTRGNSLHQNIVHLCGNTSGFHWIPSRGIQRIRFNTGTFSREIEDEESFSLWVQAPVENIECLVDLNLTKTVNKPIPKVGETIVFTISITNSTNSIASGIQVTDALPVGLTFDLASSVIPTGTTYNSNSGIWDFGLITISSGETISIQISAVVQTSNTILLNESEITAVDQNDEDSVPANGN